MAGEHDPPDVVLIKKVRRFVYENLSGAVVDPINRSHELTVEAYAIHIRRYGVPDPRDARALDRLFRIAHDLMLNDDIWAD